MTVIQPYPSPTSDKQKEFVRTVTAKGQVTIPATIRQSLRLKAEGKVIFRVQGNQITVEPVAMTLEEAFGSVKPLQRPEDFKQLRELALEEKATKIISTLHQ